MSRLTQKREDGSYVCINGEFHNVGEHINKLGRLEDFEDYTKIELITLINIVAFDQSIYIDENKVGTFYEKDKWKRVKCFIPISFNISFIYCDVWYEENFGGARDTLVIPISQYKKTWALKGEKLE